MYALGRRRGESSSREEEEEPKEPGPTSPEVETWRCNIGELIFAVTPG